MITLITGVPGAGKTLNTLKLVTDEWGESGRAIYYRGIRDLTLPWTEVTDEQLQKWWEFEDGSIFVIDEIQQVFPRRSPNVKAPEAVTRLDTHRHRGFDFYIITQKPKNFDFEARGYVGRHLHFERGYGREATRMLEWQSACDDTGDYHRRQEAQISRVKFDKKYYEVYKSAEVHTHKARVPKKFWYFIAAIFFTVAAGAYAFTSVMGRTEKGGGGPFRPDQYDPITTTPVPFGRSEVGEVPTSSEADILAYVENETPRIDGLPWTAPKYDEVTEVKTFPRPQCMRSERTNSCKCYTQQATPMDIPQDMCHHIVEGGWFNPYLEEREEQAAAVAHAAIAPPPPALSDASPRIVVLGAQRKYDHGSTAAPASPYLQPGGAYRNPSRTAPVQPRQF